MSAVFVYRLIVRLPEGSDAPGWRPEGYEDEYGHEYNGRYAEDEDAPFSFPKRRLYLSASAATARASLLTRWGADVVIERSQPVLFNTEEGT